MFSITPLSFDASPPRLQGTPTNIRINLILAESRVIGLHLRRCLCGSILIQIVVVESENACILKQNAKWRFKVI